jgi:flavin reductase
VVPASSDLLRLALSPATSDELRARFVAGMGRTAGAVAVVTTNGTAGRFGQTVTALMSVSADPPTLAIGLFRGVPVADAVRTNRCFAVNVLSVEDRSVAQAFAGQGAVSTRYTFDDAWTSLRTGSPVRTSASATFDCHAEQFLVAGSHLLILGRVVEAASAAVDGLTYADRSYGHHVPLPQ